jgi:hypothetical protein
MNEDPAWEAILLWADSKRRQEEEETWDSLEVWEIQINSGVNTPVYIKAEMRRQDIRRSILHERKKR